MGVVYMASFMSHMGECVEYKWMSAILIVKSGVKVDLQFLFVSVELDMLINSNTIMC